jgi:hypothetical protein
MRLIHFLLVQLLFYIFSIHLCSAQRVEWIVSGAGAQDGVANEYFCNGYSIAQNKGTIYAPGLVVGNQAYFGNTVISGGSLTQSYFNFLARYDTAGHILGVQEMTGVGAPYAAVDAMGNVYVTGGPSSITKVDYQGAVLGQKELESIPRQFFHIRAIATDHNNDMIVAGDYRSSDGSVTLEGSVLDFHPTVGTHFFIIKYDPAGKLKWFRSSNSSTGIVTSRIRNICISENDDIYYIGDFLNPEGASITVGDTTVSAKVLKLTPNSSMPHQDIILGKVSRDGDFDWVHTMGGPEDDWGNSIKVTPDNEIFFTGTFKDSVEVDGKYYIGKQNEILFGKISAKNSLQWFKTRGGPGNDAGRVIHLTGDAFYLGGEVGANAMLAKYNRAGDEQWAINSQGGTAGIYDLASVGNKLLFSGSATRTTSAPAFGDVPVPAIGNDLYKKKFIMGSIHLGTGPDDSTPDPIDPGPDDPGSDDPTITGVDKNAGNVSYIFPNPGEGIFNLRISEETTGEIQLTIIDAIGKVVTSFVLEKSQHDYNQLNLSNLPNGIYSVIIRGNRNRKIQILKLVKK